MKCSKSRSNLNPDLKKGVSLKLIQDDGEEEEKKFIKLTKEFKR